MPPARDKPAASIVASPMALAFVVGVVGGLASGLFGIGGGLVIVPGLVLLVGLTQHEAHATSLGAVIMIASAAAVPFLLSGNVQVVLALSMAATAVLAARAGARFMRSLSEAQLKLLFAGLMIVVAARMLAGLEPSPGSEIHDVTQIVAFGLAIGAVAGLASAVLGIGGGLIMVPAMVALLGVPQHLAEGTSLLAIVPTAVSGTLANRRSRLVTPRVVLAVGVGGVLAGLLGSVAALHLSGLVLQRGLAVLLLLTSGRMLLPLLRRTEARRRLTT